MKHFFTTPSALLLGIVISLIVVPASFAGTLKDSRDGKVYRTVRIDNLEWMAENLNYEAEESLLPSPKDDPKGKKYGRLYQRYDEDPGYCPTGWRLPKDEEWLGLLSKIGAKMHCENFGYEDESGDECDYHVWENVSSLVSKEFGGTDLLGLSLIFAGNGFEENEKSGNYLSEFCIHGKDAYDYCTNGDIYWSVRCVKE